MSYLDKEIARVEKYIAGLGIKLNKLKLSKDSYASWSPNAIDIFVDEHKTKIDLILTLIHEIGHQLYFMHNEKPQIPEEVLLEDKEMTKAQRKKIFDYESAGISLMPTIAIELGLKIPLWKVYLQSELDLWVYEYFYLNGSYPIQKLRKLKKKELVKKYKGTK